MKITSTTFEDGGILPVKYSCDHDNISPDLAWENIPRGTKSFSIVMDDPDAPVGVWTHWLIYNIPAETRHLPEHIPDREILKNSALQGRNDFRRIGYGGPCPPENHGFHHYHFKLYALNTLLNLQAGASKEQLEEAMKGHILDWAQIVGMYQRTSKTENG